MRSDVQVTFRLPKDLARGIDRVASKTGRQRSAVLRAAAEAYVEAHERLARDPPILLVRDLLGSVASGQPDLAQRHSEYVREIVRRGR